MLNFVYCFDENYNSQALTSINSVTEKSSQRINLYIIHENPKSLSEFTDSLKKTESTSCLIEVQTECKDSFNIHEEIITHIKEMQASASFKL